MVNVVLNGIERLQHVTEHMLIHFEDLSGATMSGDKIVSVDVSRNRAFVRQREFMEMAANFMERRFWVNMAIPNFNTATTAEQTAAAPAADAPADQHADAAMDVTDGAYQPSVEQVEDKPIFCVGSRTPLFIL